MSEQKHLNCITFSGIQDFISTSKTPQHLENTSTEISKYIKEIINELKIYNYEIIYPNLIDNTDGDVGVSNTVIFISTFIEPNNKLNSLEKTRLPIFLYTANVIMTDNYKEDYNKLMKKVFLNKLNRFNHFLAKDTVKYIYNDKTLNFAPAVFNDTVYTKKNKNFSLSHLVLSDFEQIKNDREIVYKIESKIEDEDYLNKFIFNLDSETNFEDLDVTNFLIKLKKWLQDNPYYKYYIIYRLDIDSFGKKISELEKDEQKNLSNELNNMFSEIYKLINKNNKLGFNKLIYAGGDDLLILFSYKTGLEFINKIHDKLEFLKVRSLTFTQGIFITHAKTDFSENFRNTNVLMEKAKNISDTKNHTVISILSNGYNFVDTYINNDDYARFFEVIDILAHNFSNSIFYADLEIQKKIGSYLKMVTDYNAKNKLSSDKIEAYKANLLNLLVVKLKRSIKDDCTNKNEVIEKVRNFFMGYLYSYNKLNCDTFFNIYTVIRFMNTKSGGDVANVTKNIPNK